MTDLLKQLTEEKAKFEAKIKVLKGEIWDLNLQCKKIDKAINALSKQDEPQKEKQPSKEA